MPEPLRLLREGVNKFHVAMPQGIDGDAAPEVQIWSAVGREKRAASSALEHQWRAVVDRHEIGRGGMFHVGYMEVGDALSEQPIRSHISSYERSVRSKRLLASKILHLLRSIRLVAAYPRWRPTNHRTP